MFSSWNEVWEKPDQMKSISQKLANNSNNNSEEIDLLTSESRFSNLLSESSNYSLVETESCKNNWKHVKNCESCKQKIKEMLGSQIKVEYENIKLKQQINDLQNNKFDNDNIKEYFYMLVAIIVIIFILYIISKSFK